MEPVAGTSPEGMERGDKGRGQGFQTPDQKVVGRGMGGKSLEWNSQRILKLQLQLPQRRNEQGVEEMERAERIREEEIQGLESKTRPLCCSPQKGLLLPH